jgi:predicted nucleotidyltransferase
MESIDVIQSRLGVPMETIREFCQRWNIVEFALFGSIVRDDFRPDSDVDVLVKYGPGGMPHVPWAPGAIKVDLEDVLGRSVDIVESGTIRNPYVRRSIMRDLTVYYAA